MERVIALVEPLDLAHVGRADQLPVDGVGPGVIGALDRFREPPARLLAQPGAAVAAHVVKRAQGAVPPPDHDHALARDGAQHVVAGCGDLGRTPDADPARREDALLLLRVDLGRGVVAAGERALALLVGFAGFDERTHEKNAMDRPSRTLSPGPPGREPHRRRPTGTPSRPERQSPARNPGRLRGPPERPEACCRWPGP